MLRQVFRLSWIFIVCLVPAVALAQGASQPNPAIAPPVVPPVVQPGVLIPPNLQQIPRPGKLPSSPSQSLDHFFPRFCSPPCVGQAPSSVPRTRVSNPIYPTMPWYGVGSPNPPPVLGSVTRYIAVPPQDVIVAVAAPSAETAPFELQDTVVTIPGYYVTETTTGYMYPERWTLDQLNVGVYQWRLLPAQFRSK